MKMGIYYCPTPKYDAVMLIAYGGPERIQDVHAFLENVLQGRKPSEAVLKKIIGHYQAIGGGSPLKALTFGQARALQQRLTEKGKPIPVTVAMRCWTPFIDEVLQELKDRGKDKILAIIMSTFQSEASWGRYLSAVDSALKQLGETAPIVEYADSFYEKEGFVQAHTENTQRVLAQIPTAEHPHTVLLFTAHSIPSSMANRSPYEEQFHRTASLIAANIGIKQYRVCYQSRSGPPHEPWLAPDINDLIREESEKGRTHLVINPIGFLCDHVEVLYDLDIEAAGNAEKHNMIFHRVPTINDHPSFIDALVDLITSE